MADVNDALAAHRAAVIDFVAAAERSAATWTTPRAPGKWSPSQVVEHVAGGFEEAANVVSGAPSIPMPPVFLRPLLRLFFFNRIVKKGVFPNGFKAHKARNPTSGPVTPAAAGVRLEGAFARFDQECRLVIRNGAAARRARKVLEQSGHPGPTTADVTADGLATHRGTCRAGTSQTRPSGPPTCAEGRRMPASRSGGRACGASPERVGEATNAALALRPGLTRLKGYAAISMMAERLCPPPR